jgi:hypothetical protein
MSVNVEPIAMVVYYNPDKKVEEFKDWHGLAIALKDSESGNVAWSGEDEAKEFCSMSRSPINYATDLYGWQMTSRLVDHICGEKHKHPAAEAAWAPSPANGFSDWFLPSAGQWILALQGIGYDWGLSNDNYRITGFGEWPWQTVGVPEAALSEKLGYWTTTETPITMDGEKKAVSFSRTGVYVYDISKTTKLPVRAFIAF